MYSLPSVAWRPVLISLAAFITRHGLTMFTEPALSSLPHGLFFHQSELYTESFRSAKATEPKPHISATRATASNLENLLMTSPEVKVHWGFWCETGGIVVTE